MTGTGVSQAEGDCCGTGNYSSVTSEDRYSVSV